MLKNIEFEEAVRIMEEQPAKTEIEEAGLEESLGRILAEDIIASLSLRRLFDDIGDKGIPDQIRPPSHSPR